MSLSTAMSNWAGEGSLVQVDVAGETVRDPVLADRAGARESEPVLRENV